MLAIAGCGKGAPGTPSLPEHRVEIAASASSLVAMEDAPTKVSAHVAPKGDVSSAGGSSLAKVGMYALP